MKKIFFGFVVVAGCVLSSCNNEAIDIDVKQHIPYYNLNVTVNPTDVPSPYKYKPKTDNDELRSFSSAHSLRVRTLVYDGTGQLIGVDSAFVSSYEAVVQSSFSLPSGTYSVVVTTDVVRGNASSISTEYWNLSKFEKLSTATLTDTRLIGGKLKMLGYSFQTITVSGADNSIVINPQTAGALLVLEYYSIHYYDNVTRIGLLRNKAIDVATIDNMGKIIPSVLNQNEEYKWWVGYLDTENESGDDIYAYAFTLPLSNVGFKYHVSYEENGETKTMDYSDPMILTLKAGDEHIFQVEFGEDGWYAHGDQSEIISLSSGTRGSILESVRTPWGNTQITSVHLTDLGRQ